jgi:hypothetical protein
MNQSTNSKISKIKADWLATSIAYLFQNDFNYWAPDSRRRRDPHAEQVDQTEAGKHKTVICYRLRANQ